MLLSKPFRTQTFSRSATRFTSRLFSSKVMSSAKPVILCGKSPQIATGVKQGLAPEYEVIHIIFNPEAGASEIPALLQGQTPPSSSNEENLGTRNYSKVPVAVVTGGGFDDAAFGQMYDAAKGKGKVIQWLRPDLTLPRPPLGPEYGKHILGRAKACLVKLDSEGKLDGQGEEGEGEVVMF